MYLIASLSCAGLLLVICQKDIFSCTSLISSLIIAYVYLKYRRYSLSSFTFLNVPFVDYTYGDCQSCNWAKVFLLSFQIAYTYHYMHFRAGFHELIAQPTVKHVQSWRHRQMQLPH